MKIDIEKFDAFKFLANFTFFGYDVVYGPNTYYFDCGPLKNTERTKIIFKKLHTDDKLVLHVDNDFKTIKLVCNYAHFNKDNDTTNFDKKIDLTEFDGSADDLNDEIEFWLAKIEQDAILTAHQVETHNEHVDYATMPANGPYSRSDAVLTARLMNEHGLSFMKNRTHNSSLKFEPPFTADNIMDWFDEAYLHLQKLYQQAVINGDNDEATYDNGPIQMRAFRSGGVDLTISLIYNFAEPELSL